MVRRSSDGAEACLVFRRHSREPTHGRQLVCAERRCGTGLDKLSLLQQRPLSDFYSALARDAMLADLLIVIGSGLADLHLNTWLAEARLRTPKPPLLFVDYWPNGFEDDTCFEVERKTIELFHRLQVHISERMRGTRFGMGWTLADDRTSAIWDRGFQAFLNAPGEMRDVLAQLLY